MSSVCLHTGLKRQGKVRDVRTYVRRKGMDSGKIGRLYSAQALTGLNRRVLRPPVGQGRGLKACGNS